MSDSALTVANDIPSDLATFFDEKWGLRLAVTFESGGLHWGVFFGTGKDTQKPSEEKKWEVSQWECTVGWRSAFPVFVLPLNAQSIREANKPNPNLATDGQLGFHNGRDRVGPNYEFLPKLDATAYLSEGKVTLNEESGSWKEWKKGGKTFRFWIADGKVTNQTQLLCYPPLSTQLVGHRGEEQSNIFPWFARLDRNRSEFKSDEAFVFAIANDKNTYSGDSPVLWRLSGDHRNRLDDVPVTLGENATWTKIDDVPLGVVAPNPPIETGSNDRPLKRLLGKTANANLVVPWLWQKESNEPHKTKSWFPLFAQKREDLKFLSSNFDFPSINLCSLDLTDEVLVFVEQKSDWKLSLLQSVHNFWNDNILVSIREALHWVDRGSAESLSPQFEGEVPEQNVMVARWKSNNTDSANQISSWNLEQLSFAGINQNQKINVSFPAYRFSGAHSRISCKHTGFSSQDGSFPDVGSFLILSIAELVFEGRYEAVDGAFGLEFSNEGGFILLRSALIDKTSNQAVPPWKLHSGNSSSLVPDFFRIDAKLPVKSLRPAGQDQLPVDQYLADAGAGTISEGLGERSEPPLVIASRSITGPFWLRTRESINPGQSHRLEMTLERDAAAPPADKINIVVLDSSPQMVSRVVWDPFRGAGKADSGGEIARKSPISIEREGWEILDEEALTEGFTLHLPAQAIGEQAVRKETDLSGISTVRFGSPLTLRIIPSRLDRNYTPAPWNLRRLFLERGAVSPGLPLVQADFELLYGLLGRLMSPRLLIGELGAKWGDLPFPLAAAPEWNMTPRERVLFDKAWGQYLTAYRAWVTRLGVLEVSHEVEPTRPAEITEGVAFRARIEPCSNETSFPIGAQVAWPLDGPEDKDLKKFHSERTHALKGGAFFGFEMLEIYREFWRPENYRKSSSAEVSGLAFSSLGGFGKQTARFANDKTVIQSETSLGRTHVYAVERIGRIGVFWNKAKHVILFERSTVPSRQFTGTGHLGRPILRKVAEYVEILEPERIFPDFAGQDPSQCGPVRGCTFRSKIMPVLSTWGNTVYIGGDAVGIEIPLWKLDLDSSVYPKPQVVLHFKAPPDSGLETIPVVLEEPQNLYFYSDVRTEVDGVTIGANVHDWPPVAEVDYTDLEDPVCPVVRPDNESNPDAPLPGALEVPPGFERLTFGISPSAMPCDVGGAYYPDCRLTGIPRTATMMRSAPGGREPEGGGDDWKNASNLITALITNANMFLNQKNRDEVLKKLRASLIDHAKTLKNTKWLSYPKLPERSPFHDLNCLIGRDDKNLDTVVGKRIFSEVLRQADVVHRVLCDAAERHYLAALQQIDKDVSELIVGSESKKEQWQKTVDRFHSAISAFEWTLQWSLRHYVARISKEFDDLETKLYPTLKEKFPDEAYDLASFKKALLEGVETFKALVESANLPEKGKQWIKTAADAIREQIASFAEKLSEDIKNRFTKEHVERLISITKNGLTGLYENAVVVFTDLAESVQSQVEALEESLTNIPSPEVLRRWRKAMNDFLKDARDEVGKNAAVWIRACLVGPKWQSCAEPSAGIFRVVKALDQNLLGEAKELEALLEKLLAESPDFYQIAKDILPDIEDPLRPAEAAHAALAGLGGEVAAIRREIKAADKELQNLRQTGTNGLRHVRSVWEEFTVPGMAGNRRRVEMICNPRAAVPDMKLSVTPFMARVRGVSDRLEGLGLRVPTVALTDRLLPALDSFAPAFATGFDQLQLSKFDFSKVLSDIGGIKLASLFPSLKTPSLSRENLIVTQGFDRATLTAWADAKADVRLAGEKTLLGFNPLKVAIRNGRFRGHARVEVDPDGKTQQVSTGSLVGDWVLSFGGMDVMVFHDVALRFEGGKMDFDLDPSKMRSPGLMQMLTEASSSVAYEDGGLRIAPILEGPVPVGVRADFGIGPVGASGGTSGIQNLHVGGHFHLQLLEKVEGKLGLSFSLGTGFYLGKRDMPFTIAIFILGGGGFFECAFKYYPTKAKLASYLRLSVHASATLAFSAGWINGGVGVYLGLEGTYEKSLDKPSSYQLSQFVMVVGYVRLCGLVTVHLVLRLDCTIKKSRDATILEGTGQVIVTIRISRFFKISVNRSITKEIARRGGSAGSGGGGPSSLSGAGSASAANVASALPQGGGTQSPLNTTGSSSSPRPKAQVLAAILA
jgi:hypothetical protein